jgi:hypothetical protein
VRYLRRAAAATGLFIGGIVGRFCGAILPASVLAKLLDKIHGRYPEFAPRSSNDIRNEAENHAGGKQ